VTDATILIPTFRHAALVPYSVRSALDQRGASVEVFVVGDGVEDDTRDALRPFADDDRVRFFDFPKGERHGELNRHEALHEAQGEIVCYLSDDDLLLPDHVSAMQGLLTGADLAHSPHFWIDVHGALNFLPRNLGRAAYVELARSGTESIELSRLTPSRATGDCRTGGEPRPPRSTPITTCGCSGSACRDSEAQLARARRFSGSRTSSGERSRSASARPRSPTGFAARVSRDSKRSSTA